MIYDRYGLIGHPIGHSRSPQLFEAAYGGRYGYDLIEAEQFSLAWERFVEGPYRAINVTAPFKADAAAMADFPDEAVKRLGAANIVVRTDRGMAAHNSDFLGVKLLLERYASGMKSVSVIGFGGAGKAAAAAAEACGLETKVLRHKELENGAEADVIIFTLPKPAPGCELLRGKLLIEANYRNPSFGNGGLELPEGCLLVPGLQWLAAQAVTGYELMTGEKPDAESIEKVMSNG